MEKINTSRSKKIVISSPKRANTSHVLLNVKVWIQTPRDALIDAWHPRVIFFFLPSIDSSEICCVAWGGLALCRCSQSLLPIPHGPGCTCLFDCSSPKRTGSWGLTPAIWCRRTPSHTLALASYAPPQPHIGHWGNALVFLLPMEEVYTSLLAISQKHPP